MLSAAHPDSASFNTRIRHRMNLRLLLVLFKHIAGASKSCAWRTQPTAPTAPRARVGTSHGACALCASSSSTGATSCSLCLGTRSSRRGPLARRLRWRRPRAAPPLERGAPAAGRAAREAVLSPLGPAKARARCCGSGRLPSYLLCHDSGREWRGMRGSGLVRRGQSMYQRRVLVTRR